MLYYSNKARETALQKIAELHAKLGNLPLNAGLDLNDIGNLHGYLQLLETELKREIKENS